MQELQMKFAGKEEQSIRGVLTVRSENRLHPLTQGFDVVYVIISDNARHSDILHYIKDNRHIQEMRVTPGEFERHLVGGHERHWLEWLMHGEIYQDPDGYLARLRARMEEFPPLLREQKLLIEFSAFVGSFQLSRCYLDEGHALDAYNSILDALIHWARIVIIEAGQHPELTVWRQVKKINAGVYKLYEELTHSNESLEQRVQLVLLACDFSVMSKIRDCCSLLLKIMRTRRGPCRPQQLMEHPDLRNLSVELSMILQKLVERSIIREVTVAKAGESGSTELAYIPV